MASPGASGWHDAQRCGYIDVTGRLAIPLQFEHVRTSPTAAPRSRPPAWPAPTV